jgi:hypothetical protein
MLQQDNKNQPVSVLTDQASKTLAADFHLGQELEPEEKKVVMTAEEAKQKEKEAEVAQQKLFWQWKKSSSRKELEQARRMADHAAGKLPKNQRV